MRLLMRLQVLMRLQLLMRVRSLMRMWLLFSFAQRKRRPQMLLRLLFSVT